MQDEFENAPDIKKKMQLVIFYLVIQQKKMKIQKFKNNKITNKNKKKLLQILLKKIPRIISGMIYLIFVKINYKIMYII